MNQLKPDQTDDLENKGDWIEIRENVKKLK
jgi:hypothetical protein